MHRQNLAVYRDMTEAQVAKAYNVMDSIPDSIGWLTKNREHAVEVEKRLKPVRDLSYGKDPSQILDIYVPDGAKKAAVLLDIHGGGWRLGSKASRAIPAEQVIKHGILWVPIDYGLAPTYSLDAIIDHVRQAIAWVYKNIATFGGDPERIYITGNSAGGHLAATALMPDWQEAYNLPSNVIRGALCISGIYDMESMMYADIETRQALRLSLDDARRTSPLYHLPKEQVPIILAYGQHEPEGFPLEASFYAQALRSAAHEVEVIEVANRDHFTIMNEFMHVEGKLFNALLGMIKLDLLRRV